MTAEKVYHAIGTKRKEISEFFISRKSSLRGIVDERTLFLLLLFSACLNPTSVYASSIACWGLKEANKALAHPPEEKHPKTLEIEKKPRKHLEIQLKRPQKP